MKKLIAIAMGLTLLAMAIAPQAEATHGRGTAFVLGALTGAIVAGAVASAYAYPPYYGYAVYQRPVIVQQPVYQPVYMAPIYTSGPYYGITWGWYVR